MAWRPGAETESIGQARRHPSAMPLPFSPGEFESVALAGRTDGGISQKLVM